MNRTLAALLCCALLALVAACSGGGPNPAALFEAAQRHQGKGEHAAAIIELRNLLAIEPQNVEARRLLALSYSENDEPGAAEDELRKAIEYGLDARLATAALGRVLLQQGKHERLLEEIKPVSDMDSRDAIELNVLRGLASLALGRAEDAKLLLVRATEADPRNSDALLGLAAIAALENKKDDAAALIDRALQANPENVDAWLVRGDFNRLHDKPAQAIEDYKQALKLKSTNINAHLQLAGLYVDQGKMDEARSHIDAVRSKLPNNPFINYLYALIEFRKKNFATALEALDDSLRKNPSHLPSLLLVGTVHYASGSHDKAIEPLRAVLERAPGSLLARRMLAASMLHAGQVQRSIELLEQGLAEVPNDSGLLAVLAEAHLQNNDLGRAIPLLERAAKANPDNPQARNRLQIARLMGGQSGAVLADLEASVKRAQPSPMTELLYAVTLVQRGQFDAALSAIAALEKKQQTPLTFNLKAAALIGKGKPDEARKALENALALNPRFTVALINLARLDLHEQGPHPARKRLESFLQREPNNAQVLTALAQMGPRIGAPADLVFEWLERARAANPRSVQQVVLLAEAHLRAGDARKALQYAEQAQQLNPDQVDVLELLGEVQVALGQTSVALGTYSKLALQNPKSPGAQFRLARVQAASNNAAAAALSLRRVLQLQPGFAPALALLGELELQAGRAESASQTAQELRRLHPKSPAGYTLEGDVHAARKSYAQAAAMYAEAYARGERSANLAIKMHMALKSAGRSQDAQSLLARFEKEHPEAVAVQAYLGDDHLFAGRYADAIERYNQVLKLQPQNALVLNNLAWASHQVKDRRAREYAEKAYALRPDHPVILDTFGWLLVDAGQNARGIELLQRAVTMAPEDSETRYHLAQALVKSGDFARARRELESLLGGRAKFDKEAEVRALLTKLR
jgi:putative PEP-CTERM system TPR-repeat lipoprotein